MAKLVANAKEKLSDELVGLPCGQCIGCKVARAREWAVRCRLESFEHRHTSVWTLTYDDAHRAPDIAPAVLSGFLKRVRYFLAPQKVRFFASGERGDRFGRPHYHAILFGVRRGDPSVQRAWPNGLAYHDVASDEAMAYVAGYVAKKLIDDVVDEVDADGVVLEKPFRLMSRRPGIAAAARRRNPRAFRENVANGTGVQPAPLYLKKLWQDEAGLAELREHGLSQLAKFREMVKTGAFDRDRLDAGEIIAKSRRRLMASSL